MISTLKLLYWLGEGLAPVAAALLVIWVAGEGLRGVQAERERESEVRAMRWVGRECPLDAAADNSVNQHQSSDWEHSQREEERSKEQNAVPESG